MANITIDDILLRIGERLNKIDAAMADTRNLTIKAIQQSTALMNSFKLLNNNLDDFLSPDIQMDSLPSEINMKNKANSLYINDLMEMLRSFHYRIDELKQFEQELEKYQHEITPGSMGES